MKSKNKVIGIMLVAILGITILFFTNVNFAANTAKVNVETANLRETADENSKILVQLSLNDNVEVLDNSSDWCKVKSNDITGYVRKDLITLENSTEDKNEISTTKTEENTSSNSETTTQNTSTEQEEQTTEITNEQIVKENTKLKIVPVINATDIVEVKKDEKVNVVEVINDWVCVQTNTTKGWIRKDKLTTQKEIDKQKEEQEKQKQEEAAKKPIKTAYIKETSVNLRKEANQTSEIVKTLVQNTSVEVYSEENGWSKVKVSGEEGYISTSLLSDNKVETTENRTNTTNTTNTTSRSSTKARTTQVDNTETTKTTTASSGKGSTVIATAKNYIGSKYVYGASGPNSFDCSGFTSYVFKLHGISLSRTAQGQYSNGTAVARSDLQAGDLVMFGSSASGINHVGIYIGGGQIVHAANPSRGVTIDSITSGYYNNKYVGARRVM